MNTPEESKAFAEKITADGQGPITFAMLSDPGHRVIDGYGLRDPAYTKQKFEGIPYPAVYVIDKNGRVAWSKIHQDYKQRPTPGEIRAALDSLN